MVRGEADAINYYSNKIDEFFEKWVPGYALWNKANSWVAQQVQKGIDWAGEGIFHESWHRFRNVVNFQNRYIRAAITIAGVAAALIGLKRVFNTGAAAAGEVIEEAGEQNVYYGIRNGERVYVGRSKDLRARARSHRQRFDSLEQINESGLSRKLADGIEQVIKEDNPHFENKYNPIDRNNPNRSVYYDEATRAARDWIQRHQ